MINFTWRSGILEAADPASCVEWCWFKGDLHITVSRDADPVGTIDAPEGAGVTTIKAIIRRYARGYATGNTTSSLEH